MEIPVGAKVLLTSGFELQFFELLQRPPLFAVMVISPFAKASAVSFRAILIGLLVGVFSLGLGYLLDEMGVQ